MIRNGRGLVGNVIGLLYCAAWVPFSPRADIISGFYSVALPSKDDDKPDSGISASYLVVGTGVKL